MPSVLEYTLGKCYVCRVLDIMHSANRKHSAFSPFPVVVVGSEKQEKMGAGRRTMSPPSI